MSALGVRLHGPRYVLGETEVHHTEIGNVRAKAEEFRMQPTAALWGWGNVRRAERGQEYMAAESAAATLRAAGADPSSVDAAVVCSTRVPGPPEDHGRFMETFLTRAGLGDIAFYGQNLNRCVNLLAAIDTATALVAAGRHRRVLVVTADRAAREEDRMVSYALFSDGAASCLIAAEGELPESAGSGYEVVGCATAQDRQTLGHTNEISADLARTVNDRLLAPVGMKPDDLAGLMHANIFTPIAVMKERQAGFAPEQLFTDNIARVGHCYAADPLINLTDRAARGDVVPGRHYMLAAAVPGQRIGVLLKKGHDR